MSTGTHKSGNVLVVTPPPRLDSLTSPAAEETLMLAIQKGEIQIVVDFAKTDYISSAGLRILLKTTKLVQPKGGMLALCNANPQVREVLEISGYLSKFPHYASLREAIAQAER